jgi:hypothetical protein
MKTNENMARKIASRFAARVPGPEDGITIESTQRRSEPKTPPNETRSTGFSFLTYFFSGLRIVVITLMIRDAKSADQKPETSSFSLQRAVSESIAALTTKRKRPKVTMDTGKVSTLIMEPKNVLIKPNRSATHK